MVTARPRHDPPGKDHPELLERAKRVVCGVPPAPARDSTDLWRDRLTLRTLSFFLFRIDRSCCSGGLLLRS